MIIDGGDIVGVCVGGKRHFLNCLNRPDLRDTDPEDYLFAEEEEEGDMIAFSECEEDEGRRRPN